MAREPIHPGEFLADELAEIGVKPSALAQMIHVPANRISQILRGQRMVTADTALRLGRFFGTGADFWMNLQKAYDIDSACEKSEKEIQSIPRWTDAEQGYHRNA